MVDADVIERQGKVDILFEDAGIVLIDFASRYASIIRPGIWASRGDWADRAFRSWVRPRMIVSRFDSRDLRPRCVIRALKRRGVTMY